MFESRRKIAFLLECLTNSPKNVETIKDSIFSQLNLNSSAKLTDAVFTQIDWMSAETTFQLIVLHLVAGHSISPEIKAKIEEVWKHAYLCVKMCLNTLSKEEESEIQTIVKDDTHGASANSKQSTTQFYLFYELLTIYVVPQAKILLI